MYSDSNSCNNDALMNNTFQQFVRDEMPPVIRKFEVLTDGEVDCVASIGRPCWPNAAWTVVTVQVVDPSSYTITVTVVDNGRSESFDISGYAEITTTIPIDIFSDVLLDYHVRVRAVDVVGNAVESEEKVEGIIGAIVEFFASVLGAIWGAIVATVEAILSALSFIVEWILNMITDMVMSVIEAFSGIARSHFTSLAVLLERLFLEFEGGGIRESTVVALVKFVIVLVIPSYLLFQISLLLGYLCHRECV